MDVSVSSEHDIGSIKLHHTFNGVVPVGRGWLPCNGTQVSQSQYDAIHGTGAWDVDGGAQSPIVGLYTPNFTGRYPVGVTATTKTGVTSTDMIVGNANHVFNLGHTHGMDHVHAWYFDSSPLSGKTFDSSGNVTSITDNSVTKTGGNKGILVGTGVNNYLGDSLGNSLYTDNANSPGGGAKTSTDSANSAVTIQPPSIEVIYYIRVV